MKRYLCALLFCSILVVPGMAGYAFCLPLPDTGQVTCYGNEGEISCPNRGEPFYGQDGNYLINPPSFTKLDARGSELPHDAPSWVMVRDNVTGLVWEGKTDVNRGASYTWAAGENSFVTDLNRSEFGGYSDWRLPTVGELQSIANYGESRLVTFEDYFPRGAPSRYWTYDVVASAPGRAWSFSFEDGTSHADRQGESLPVRAVRSGRPGLPDELVDNGDGTVTDPNTGLMWQQDAAFGVKVWKEALARAEGLTLAGHSDWRLPTVKELYSIVSLWEENPAADSVGFPEMAPFRYWSSTTSSRAPGQALVVNFSQGHIGTDNKSSEHHVRIVRGGQNLGIQQPLADGLAMQILSSGNLVITSPSQGSTWYRDDVMAITWNTADLGGNVSIYISRNGGTDYQRIISEVPNDGRAHWTVTGPASTSCMIKIIPDAGPAKEAIQGLFTIRSHKDVHVEAKCFVTTSFGNR